MAGWVTLTANIITLLAIIWFYRSMMLHIKRLNDEIDRIYLILGRVLGIQRRNGQPDKPKREGRGKKG